MIKKIPVFVFLISMFLYSEESGKTNSSEVTNYISYQYYIDMIKTSLPDITLNYINVQKSENNLMRTRSSGDLGLTAEAGAIGTHGAQGAAIQNTPQIAANGFALSAGLSSLIPYTGTKWSVSLSHETLAYKKPAKAVNYSPQIDLTITQPLLKNFLGMADRFLIEDAKLAVDISKLQSSINNNAVLVSYQKMYYQWIGLEKIIKDLDYAVSNAKNMENQTLRRFRAGLLDNDSYQQSKAKVFQYQDTLTQYIYNINSLLTTIRFFITNEGILVPDQTQWDRHFIIASEEIPKYIDFQNSTHGMLAEQNGYKIAQAIAVQKNLTMPDISFVGNMSLGAEDRSGYFSSFNKMTNINYFVGFQFSYPIGNRSAKANLREAELALEQFNEEYRKMLMTYDNNMRNCVNKYSTVMSLIETKKNRLLSLQSTLATQRIKYNQGRLDLIDLINTETEIIVEKMNLIEIELQLMNNYFDYKELFTLTHML